MRWCCASPRTHFGPNWRMYFWLSMATRRAVRAFAASRSCSASNFFLCAGYHMMTLGGQAVRAEIVCPDPATGTPEATPAAEIIPQGSFPEDGGELTVFAAASLTDAFAEIATAVESEHEGMEITIETGGSQQLVTQLEEGAGADVLATADDVTMVRAQESELLAGAPLVFAHNRLVIVTPADNPSGIDSIDDLAGEDIRLVLANGDVPAGRYTAQAFCAYANTASAPNGFIDAINSNLVSEEPDVRHVLTKVQVGETDAGVVYASDAAASEINNVDLQVLEFPTGLSAGVHYPIAAVDGGNVGAANAFIAFVLSDAGQQILRKYGFD